MTDDTLTANTNDPTEKTYLDQAHAAIQAGIDPAKVADRLTSLVHTYRASLATKKDAAPPETAGDVAAGLLGNAYQGLTLGAGNKFMAGVRTALPEALGGEKGFDYAQALRDVTQPTQDFAAAHPVAAGAANIMGALPTLALGGGALEGLAGGAGKAAAAARAAGFGEDATGTLGRLAQLARQGASTGAVTGALSANTPSDIVPNAVAGGVGGAVLAPAVGLPVGAASRGLASAANIMASPATKALQTLAGAGRAAGTDFADVASEGAQGAPVSPLDIPVVRNLARQARNVPGSTAQNDIDAFLTTRASQTGPRIQSALSQGTGFPPEQASQTADQLIEQARADSKPLYDAAMAHDPIPLTAQASADGPTLADVLHRPSLKSAIGYNNKLVAENPASGQAIALGEAPKNATGDAALQKIEATLGRPLDADTKAKMIAQNPDLFGPQPEQVQGDISMPSLHNLKLRLDEMLGYAKTHGQLPDATPATKSMLRAIQQSRGDLLDIVDSQNPTYGVARRAFAGPAALKDAFEAGQEHFSPSLTPADAATELASYETPAEQQLYRRGALTALRDQIQQVTANPDLPEAARKTNIVQRVLGSAPQSEKAAMLFGSPDAYQDFLGQMATEARFPKTQGFLMNQSSTAAQQAERAMPVNAWTAYNALETAKGNPMAAMRLGRQMFAGSKGPAMSVPVANALGQLLTTSGADVGPLAEQLRTVTTPAARAALVRRLAATGSAEAAAP